MPVLCDPAPFIYLTPISNMVQVISPIRKYNQIVYCLYS